MRGFDQTGEGFICDWLLSGDEIILITKHDLRLFKKTNRPQQFSLGLLDFSI